MSRKVLLVRIAQLLFFAAVGLANWFKADGTDDSFYQVVMIICVLGFVAVLFTLYFSWKKNKV